MVFLLLGLASVNANEIGAKEVDRKGLYRQELVDMTNEMNTKEVDIKERNGTFVGVEIGTGDGKMNVAVDGLSVKFKMKNTIFSYGVKAGYKYFFNEYFGLRGYGSVNYLSSHYKVRGTQGFNGDNSRLSFLDFGANVDLLFNFYNTNDTNFGAFVGVGVGGVWANYKGTFGVDEFESGGITGGRLAGINGSKFDLMADAKLGLRLNLLQSHGIEFIARIPFVTNNKKIPPTAKNTDAHINAKFKPNYTLSLGYLYTF